MRYFVRLRDNPEAENYGQPMAAFRFDGEAGVAERWNPEEQAWEFNPNVLDAFGVGGTTDFREVPEADAEAFINRGGPGSGHFQHEGRPGERGGSAPGGGGMQPDEPKVYVGEKDALAHGTKDTEWNGAGFHQPSGAPIRGEYIALDDPRIPETVYHMTTNMSGKEEAGIIRRGGKAKATALGGDPDDQMVSLTIDENIASQLASDMRFVGSISREYLERPTHEFVEETENPHWVWKDSQDEHVLSDQEMKEFGQHLADRINDLDESRPPSFRFEPHADYPQGSMSVKDEMMRYFQERERQGGAGNPVLFGEIEGWATINPQNVGYIAIPKANLDTGALITNFDLGNQFGLKEIRIYGDLSLTEARFIKPETTQRGGPGSGHFGHAGRPGQRGGSAPGGGSEPRYDMAGKWQPGTSETTVGSLEKWSAIVGSGWQDSFGRTTNVEHITNDAEAFMEANMSRGGQIDRGLLDQNASEMEQVALGAYDKRSHTMWIQDERGGQNIIGTGRWIAGAFHEMGHAMLDELPWSKLGDLKVPDAREQTLFQFGYPPPAFREEYAADLLSAHAMVATNQSSTHYMWRETAGRTGAFQPADYKNLNRILALIEEPQVAVRAKPTDDYVMVIYPLAGEAISTPRSEVPEAGPDDFVVIRRPKEIIEPPDGAYVDSPSRGDLRRAAFRRWLERQISKPLTERGGAGSGHFGHSGRPGERGGSAPGEGGGRLYHGTSIRAAQAILKDGLLLSKAGKSLSQRPLVWTTNSKETARHYGASGERRRFAVVALDRGKIKAETEKSVSFWNVFAYQGDIPPEAVVSIEIYEAVGGDARSGYEYASQQIIKRSSDDRLYAVITLTDDEDYEILPMPLLALRGGPGSGHFGHAGRPGERGGSAPGGGPQYDKAPQGKPYEKLGSPDLEYHDTGTGFSASDLSAIHQAIDQSGSGPGKLSGQGGHIAALAYRKAMRHGGGDKEEMLRQSVEEWQQQWGEDYKQGIQTEVQEFVDEHVPANLSHEELRERLEIDPEEWLTMSHEDIQNEVMARYGAQYLNDNYDTNIETWGNDTLQDTLDSLASDNQREPPMDELRQEVLESLENAEGGIAIPSEEHYIVGYDEGDFAGVAQVTEAPVGSEEHEGEVVNRLSGTPYEAYADDDFMVLHFLAAAKSGEAYGTKIMRQTFRMAAERDMGLIGSSVQEAIEFYDKLGVRYTGGERATEGSDMLWTPEGVKQTLALLESNQLPAEEASALRLQQKTIYPWGILGFRWEERGGPGSGHFGHEGRPGERGGSAPGEGGGSAAGIVDKVRTEVRGFHDRQTDGSQLAYDKDGKLLGHLDWSEFEGRVQIDWIEVNEASRRQGVGKTLVESLVKEFEGKPIDWGYVTDEGKALQTALESEGHTFGGGTSLSLALSGGTDNAEPEDFHSAIENAFTDSEYTNHITHYSVDDLAEMRTLMLSNDGQTGMAVKDHGDGRIEGTALFNQGGPPGAGLAMLRLGVEAHGVNYLEAYGPVLPKLYGQLGFQVVEKSPFSPTLAPPGWDYDKFDSPDYFTMRLP